MAFKIHPGIGLSRIGDSKKWFVDEETADEPEGPESYRDSKCRFKRKGARFRIWEHDANGPVAEITSEDAVITWTVRLAAIGKAAPAAVTLNGPNQKVVLSVEPFAELRTDDLGRLIVLSVVTSEFLDVYDGTADGWVKAHVAPSSGAAANATPSWVTIGPPDYAPAIRPVRNVYATIVEALDLPVPSPPSFLRDVFPILRAASDVVDALTGQKLLTNAVLADLPGLDSLGGQTKREEIVAAMTGPQLYPTAKQLEMLAEWVSGTSVNDWALRGEPIPETPSELDRGPLEHAFAGGTAWEFYYPAIVDPAIYAEPFRFDLDEVSFGFTRQGLPDWRSDLLECGFLWPSQATLLVPGGTTGGNWATRGFVRRESGELYLDESCDAKPKKSNNDDVIIVADRRAARRILHISGGGLGDGTVIVMTEHGPVVIGPGDPGYRRSRRVARDVGEEGRKLVRRKRQKERKKTKKNRANAKQKKKAKKSRG